MVFSLLFFGCEGYGLGTVPARMAAMDWVSVFCALVIALGVTLTLVLIVRALNGKGKRE